MVNSASGGYAFDELAGWKRWLSGLNVKMELYPANGQGFIYDNSYTKQYGLERGLHIGIYDVNIGFEYALPLTKARTCAGNPRAELALQTELYGCRHFLRRPAAEGAFEVGGLGLLTKMPQKVTGKDDFFLRIRAISFGFKNFCEPLFAHITLKY